MQIIVEKNYEHVSKRAAELVTEMVTVSTKFVLGLPTGSTPIGLYKELIRKVATQELSFKHVTTFNLDEYIGLPPSHPQSYHSYMLDKFFKHVDLNLGDTNIPSGISDELDKECRAYDKKICDSGGIDLQVLGIGQNGHIGFNEPGVSFNKMTHVVKLSAQTRQANSRFFDTINEVPSHAITMGLQNILNSRKIVLLASGGSKNKAVYEMIQGPVTENCPASILQLHQDCTLILDKEAANSVIKTFPSYLQKGRCIDESYSITWNCND